jgi:hypothetical protein
MKQRKIISALTISLVLLSQTAQGTEAPPQGLAFGLITSVGSNLDKQENKASLSLEPAIRYTFDGTRYLELYSALDRPFNGYERLAVPKTILTFGQGLDLFQGVQSTATAAVTALSLDRWAHDGHMVRASVALANAIEIAPGLNAALKVGPYAQSNAYHQTTSGKDLPKFGFSEKVTLDYTIGPVTLGLAVLFDQKYATNWKNGYSTLEQAGVQVAEGCTVGVAHELVGSAIDDSTGFFRPVQVFNERNSRVSAFVEYQL